MTSTIASKLNQFKDKGDISDLISLDSIPFGDFEHINIRQQAYLWCRSTGSENFTCYQHSMAYILDNFHPGIAAYIAKEVKNRNIDSDNYVDMLNAMLREIDKYTFDYATLLNEKNNAREMDDAKMFKAIEGLETKISEGGYIMALGFYHGEVYHFSEKDGKTMMTLIQQRSAMPIYLWERGKVAEWYSENIDKSRIYSNTDILEGDILVKYREIHTLKTRFFGREEVHKAFEQTDLRDIIHNTLFRQEKIIISVQ